MPCLEFTVHPRSPETVHPEIVRGGCTFVPTNGFGLANREDRRQDSNEFGPAPDYWPLKPSFEKEWILVDRRGELSYESLLGEARPLGLLSEGKPELLRPEQEPAPQFCDLSPGEARRPEGDCDCLYPTGVSVRCKTISAALYGRQAAARTR